MNRLTVRDKLGRAWYKINHTDQERREAFAAYEDTGLTPDELTTLRDQLDHAVLVLDAYKTDIAALKAEAERLRTAAKEIELIVGRGIDHLEMRMNFMDYSDYSALWDLFDTIAGKTEAARAALGKGAAECEQKP